jgi:hypothetical protein
MKQSFQCLELKKISIEPSTKYARMVDVTIVDRNNLQLACVTMTPVAANMLANALEYEAVTKYAVEIKDGLDFSSQRLNDLGVIKLPVRSETNWLEVNNAARGAN